MRRLSRGYSTWRNGIMSAGKRQERRELPERRFVSRNSLPPSKGGRPQRVLKPNLRQVEQTLFILLSKPGVWFLVDEYWGQTSTTSAIRNALYRRGAETRIRSSEAFDGLVQVWARWTHDVPENVGGWEISLKAPGSAAGVGFQGKL